MNSSSRGLLAGVVGLLAFVCLVFSSGLSQAQTNYYFDPGHSHTGTGSGGTGTWDTGLPAVWYDGTSDTTFPTAVPTGVAGDPNAPQGNANFDGAGGTVTVSGSVNPANLYVNSTGAYDLVSDGTGSIDFNFPASTGYYAGGYFGSFLKDNGGDLTIHAPITFNFNPSSNTSVVGFGNYGTGTLTLDGDITFNNEPGSETFNVFNPNGGKVVINSTITSSNFLVLGTNGNAEFDGNIGTNMLNAETGTLLIDKGTGFGALVGQSGTVLTNGAITVGAGLNQFTRSGGFGGATADVSTYDSIISNYAGVQTLTAAVGGRVNFNGEINQSDDTDGTGRVFVLTGGGTIVLNNGSGQTYGYSLTTPTVSGQEGTEIMAGTTVLINNTANSAFGNDQVVPYFSINKTYVQLDSGATLGGTGISSQEIRAAADGTSIVTAGDPGQASLHIAPKIGALTLQALTANNGLNLDFKLAPSTGQYNPTPGVDNDVINVVNLTLNGTVNVNISIPGSEPATAETPYLLMAGNGGTWTDDPDTTTFNFNLPYGYALDTSYEQGGYFFDTEHDEFTIEFAAVPEPSAYVLIGLGLASCGVLSRFRKLAS